MPKSKGEGLFVYCKAKIALVVFIDSTKDKGGNLKKPNAKVGSTEPTRLHRYFDSERQSFLRLRKTTVLCFSDVRMSPMCDR